MTNKELNRDIKRLGKKFVMLQAKFNQDIVSVKDKVTSNELWDNWTKEQEDMKKEFSRLYGADKSLAVLNAHSLRVLIFLNFKMQIEPGHRFGSWLDLR